MLLVRVVRCGFPRVVARHGGSCASLSRSCRRALQSAATLPSTGDGGDGAATPTEAGTSGKNAFKNPMESSSSSSSSAAGAETSPASSFDNDDDGGQDMNRAQNVQDVVVSNDNQGRDAARAREFARLRRTPFKKWLKPEEVARALAVIAPLRDEREYASIINAWGRAGRPDDALACFGELRATLGEDREPSLVTHNVAIAACGRAWRRSVALLDRMVKTGNPAPDAISYNSAIANCGRGPPSKPMRPPETSSSESSNDSVIDDVENAPQEGYVEDDSAASVLHMRDRRSPAVVGEAEVNAAFALFDAMRARDLKASAVTYTALITACARAGDWRRALRTLRWMDVDPDNQAFNAAISACARAGRIAELRDLLRDMDVLGVRPNAVTYNAAMAAVERDEAERLFEDMRRRKVPATRQTYSLLVDKRVADPDAVLKTLYDMSRDLDLGPDGPRRKPNKHMATVVRAAADHLAASPHATPDQLLQFRNAIRQYGIAPTAPFAIPARQRQRYSHHPEVVEHDSHDEPDHFQEDGGFFAGEAGHHQGQEGGDHDDTHSSSER